MIKRIAVILSLYFLIIMPLTVYSDIIVKPENDFYKKHQSQIMPLGRSFSVNGESGSVSVKKEPGSKYNTANLQNDTITYIEYSCLYDGDYWGFTSNHSGWVKLDQMLVLYDYVAFEEDHFSELYLYSGDYAGLKKAKAAIAWPWPGADFSLWTFEDLDTENFRASYAYMDDKRREWGFVTYLYGNRNIWICLSDPLNRDIPAFNPAPEPGIWESGTNHIDIKQNSPPSESTILNIIIVLVITLVTGTAVLIRMFWKPNKSEEKTS